MRNIRKFAIAALSFGIGATLSACMTIGTKFDVDRVSQLQPGISTIDDAVSILGPAKSESTYADNSRLLQWQYVQGTPVGGNGAHVAILFDRSGKMVRVTHKSKT